MLIAATTPEGILLGPTATLPVELFTPDRIKELEVEEDALAEVLRGKKG